MNPKTTTLAALAGSALLAAGALATTPWGPNDPASPANGQTWSSSNSISIQHNSGQDPVVVINGHQIEDDDITIGTDGSILIDDGSGNMINLMDQFGAMRMGAGPMTQSAPSQQPMETRPVIGVRLQPVSPSLASHLGLHPGTGVLVSDVQPGMPAAQARMQQWDIITAVNGLPIASPDELSAVLAEIDPASGVVIDCIRGGQATTATVTPKLVDVPRHATTWPAMPMHGGTMMQDQMQRMQALMDQMMQRSPLGAGIGSGPGSGLHQHWPTAPMQAVPAPSNSRPVPQRERTPLTPIDPHEAI